MKSIFFKETNNIVSRFFYAIRGHSHANLKDYRNKSCNDSKKNSNVYLFSVINGLRPVNLKDYRIKSGNDCGLECIVSGNDRCLKRWFNTCCKFVNTPHSALSCHSLPQGARECGRSMIEMLGVLAIIGVLSVGGIAGYSKAMEKFKLNKTIDEYSYLIYGLLEHIYDLRSVPSGRGQFNFTDFARAINIVPSSWTAEDNKAMWDNNGNIVQSYRDTEFLLLDFYLGGWKATDNGKISTNFSPKLCVEMFNNIMIPLHSAVYSINTYSSNKRDITFYGDAYCSSGRMCLSNATLAQIKSACEHCDASGVCCITIRFPL